MQFQLKRFRAGWATGSTEQRGGRHEETEGLRVAFEEHAESNQASLVDAMRAERARVCERWCAVSYHLFLPLLCSGLDFHVQAVTSGTTPTARRRLGGSFLQPGRHWKGLPFADCHGQTRTEL